jgi:hypothetical protein
MSANLHLPCQHAKLGYLQLRLAHELSSMRHCNRALLLTQHATAPLAIQLDWQLLFAWL